MPGPNSCEECLTGEEWGNRNLTSGQGCLNRRTVNAFSQISASVHLNASVNHECTQKHKHPGKI